jgi:hypothetical protein
MRYREKNWEGERVREREREEKKSCSVDQHIKKDKAKTNIIFFHSYMEYRLEILTIWHVDKRGIVWEEEEPVGWRRGKWEWLVVKILEGLYMYSWK